MTSPGSRVKKREQNAMSSATPWIRSAVDASWRTSPLTVHRIERRPGSGSSSRVTIQGPIGQNVSRLLARTHCPSWTCMSRAETSLRQVYPSTASSASAAATSRVRRPMTTPSSAS